MADSPYFDRTYFDSTYFDTDTAPAVTGGGSRKVPVPIIVVQPEPLEDPDELLALI